MGKNVLAALLVLVVAMCGCSRAPSRRHELHLSLPSDPMSLSPLYAFNQDEIALDQFWCQTLVGLDANNRFFPILSTRVPSRENGDISADGLRLTYHLRPNVRFADGVALTSADVAFTYRAILEPANAAPAIGQYQQRIAALTTPNDHTVVIHLRKRWNAAVPMLFAQADFAYGILPKHAFTSFKVSGSSWEQKPFGTGPFRVDAWARGDRIELTPNPYFKPKPRLQRIVVHIVPNQTSAYNALRTHEVDAAELNPDNVTEAGTIDGLRITRTPENGLAAVYLQTATAPTQDIRVRHAIAYALDPPHLGSAWHNLYPFAGSVLPAPIVSWPAMPPAMYPHDLALAKRELDAAGWRLRGGQRKKNGLPLALLIVADSTQPVLARIAVAVQAQLAALRADVTIKTYTSTLLAAPDGPLRTGRFSVLVDQYIGGSDPEQSLNLLCSDARAGGGNYARYCSRRFETLFTRQMNAPSDRARDRDFDDIAEIVHEDVPLIPLYYPFFIEGVNSRVTGFRRNMLRFAVRPETWDAR